MTRDLWGLFPEKRLYRESSSRSWRYFKPPRPNSLNHLMAEGGGVAGRGGEVAGQGYGQAQPLHLVAVLGAGGGWEVKVIGGVKC